MKHFSITKALIIIIIVAAAGILVFRARTPVAVVTPPGNSSGVDTSGWNTKTDGGVTFRYPTDFGTKYINTVDWPPKALLIDAAYSCTEGGSSISLPAGQTKAKVINGHTYCVTQEGEGAAGSTYIQYAYAAPKDGKTLIMTFTLREVQCANYDDPQKTECQTERDAFNPDATVDAMFGTVTS